MTVGREQGRIRVWLLAAALALAYVTAGRPAWGASQKQITACNGALTVTPVSSLGFGTIVAGASGGTVTVDTTGAATASGVTLLAGSVSSAASFTLNVGTTNCTAVSTTISVVSPATLSSGSNSMTVTNFTTSPASGTNYGNSSVVTLYVGGTLNVGANQPAGAYSGQFTVTVAFP